MNINSKMMNVEMAKQGITLIKLSELTGISRATLSAVKNGKTCSFKTAVNVAKVLNIEVMDFIESEV